jgi:transposase
MVELVLPQSALGRAIHYALSQWRKLEHFHDCPKIRLDTKRVENALRLFVIGRRGGCSATPSLAPKPAHACTPSVETANSLGPHAYLTHLFTELPKATNAEHFEALLPWSYNVQVITDVILLGDCHRRSRRHAYCRYPCT